jgi:hypothetical protein
MRITIYWLTFHGACFEGLEWFEENFPRGGTRDGVLKKLGKANRLEDYSWLLENTLGECPLPRGWTFPEGLEELYLGGTALPVGTRLPAGLRHLALQGGTLPEGTVLPEGLRELDLRVWRLGASGVPDITGIMLPPGTVLPEGLEWLYLGGGTLPQGTRVPDGCVVYY